MLAFGITKALNNYLDAYLVVHQGLCPAAFLLGLTYAEARCCRRPARPWMVNNLNFGLSWGQSGHR